MNDDDPAALEAEAAVLNTEAGESLLAQVDAVATPGPADLQRWRGAHPVDHVTAALRLVDARRRAAGKIYRPETLWLDRVGVEQATHEAVAAHKAARFQQHRSITPIWDLCCGLGMDSSALAAVANQVIAVDLRQSACRRALWNARARDVAGRVVVVRGRAEQFRFGSGDWVHLDPDRRSTTQAGRERSTRAGTIEGYAPGLPYLRGLIDSGASGAIKLGPASDFALHFDRAQTEIEVVSLSGECKEATVWFGDARSCSRRATMLPTGASWSDAEHPHQGRTARPATHVGAYIFDPDPALVRAGVLDGFAIAHGLERIAPGVDWLTGGHPVESPFLHVFQVIEALPMDERRLRAAVAAAGGGSLDVRSRGYRRTPEQVRRALRPRGSRPLTLFLHGGEGGRAGFALLAEPARIST